MDLDGSSQLTIFFSKKEESEQQYQYMHTDSFGVSWYYVDEAEIDRQRKLKKEEQEEYYLNIIVDTLKHIARINNRDAEIFNMIDETASKVRDADFELTLHIKKLSRTSANGQFRANVYRHICDEGENWYVEMKDKDKNITRYSIDLTDEPLPGSATELYERSKWDGNRFIVTDRLGRVAATIDV